MNNNAGTGWLQRQRRAIYLLVGLLTVGGVWAGLHLPSSIYPELKFSRITVVANVSALGVRQVLFDVTRPIEQAVAVVPGVSRIQSRAIRGGSESTITFSPGTDMQVALQQVRSRLSQAGNTLPAETELQVERLKPSLFPIVSWNLEGGDPARLYDIARYQLKPIFSRVPGVARVDVMGSVEREIEVVASPLQLAAHGYTWDDLAGAIRAATTISALGQLPADYRQYLLLSGDASRSASDVANLIVGRNVRVSDLATVGPGTTDRVKLISGDGQPAAILNVSRQVGGNSLAIADSITAIANGISATLPPGVHLVPVYDQSILIRDAVKSVRDAMLIGAFLAVLVLLVFLRELRVTAISAAVIPLTMAITILLMSLMGESFNLMTLGAMAVAIGLVIDDAVVVTENIVRHLRLHDDRSTAVRLAVGELAWPVTTSTLTTIVVFLPLGLLTGVEGQFFKALALTLAVSVSVSLLLAFTLIPVLSEQFLEASPTGSPDPASDGSESSHGRLDRVADWYARSLDAVLHHRSMALGVVIALLACGAIAYRQVGTGFLPEIDEGAFVLDYYTPGGTSLDETNRELHQVEKIMAETPEIEATSRRTGAELGLFATGQNTGDLVARLLPPNRRSRTTAQVIDEVRHRIETEVPGLRIEFVQILSDVINDLAGVRRPVEIRMFGTNLDQLEQYGRKLGNKLSKVSGLEDVYDGVSEKSAEKVMSVHQEALRRTGLSQVALTQQVQGALSGVSAGRLLLDDRTIGIRVRSPDSVRYAPSALGTLPILVPGSNNPLPLATLASFSPRMVRGEFWRENQQQLITLTGDLGNRNLGSVMVDVRRVLNNTPPPSGVRIEIGGQYAGQQAAFRALMVVLALAALSVVTVMVVQFQSFVEPTVILLAAPLSFAGAMALLWITGTVLNVSSLMGLIFLVGLVVKNGIILLDFCRRRLLEGVDLRTAVIDAGRVRLRPILMTTLCTLFGLLPLALGLGAGSEMQRPLAIAVLGGLALSTPITLYLVPILLVAIRGRNYNTQTGG